MHAILRRSTGLALAAILAFPLSGASAQTQDAAGYGGSIDVYGSMPSDLSGLPEGPEIEGFISARDRNSIQVTRADGAAVPIGISSDTRIRSRGGFLGLDRTEYASDALLNGLPVTVETVAWEGGLVASRVKFGEGDYETAAMIRNGTEQRFAQHDVQIENLRGRVSDIDQYNIHGTTDVYFDTGRAALSPQAEAELCSAAAQAGAMDNALLLVVGYTDSTGDQDYNQVLSERRAGKVVNYLQQQCGWAPYRMLTPTGMAEAAPQADNTTASGRAQNRRVSVNVLVSKAVEGL